MADQTLQDDMTKLVRYSVSFVKRDYECVLKTAEELVSDNLDGSGYTTWKIAELIQGLDSIPIPAVWQRKNYPRAVAQQSSQTIGSLPEDDKKYLRVSYKVLQRWPRERFKFEERQVEVLRDIRDTLRRGTPPPQTGGTPVAPGPGPSGGPTVAITEPARAIAVSADSGPIEAPSRPMPAASGYAAIVLTARPQGYWKLDETSGTTVADSSGHNHHGTVHGGVTLGREGAMANSHAAAFDGSTGYIDIATGTWGGGREVTVEAWVNVSQTSTDFEAVVGALSQEFVHLQLFSAGNIAVYVNSGYALLPILSQEPLNTWRHLALVATPGATRLYVDGKEVATDPTSFATITPTSTLRIGNGYQGGRFFAGLIDEVAIYDHALSAERIQAHAAARFPETVAIATRLDSTKLIHVLGGVPDVGAQITLWDDIKSTNEHWQMTALGNGYYRITSRLDASKVLSTPSLENNTNLVLATWEPDNDTQQWQLITLADGYYHIASKSNANKLVYVFGGHTANGTAIVMWDAHGGNNCQWQIRPGA